jgi:predicted nucleotide-binding protein
MVHRAGIFRAHKETLGQWTVTDQTTGKQSHHLNRTRCTPMRVFISSSNESKGVMHRVARWLEDLGHDPVPWVSDSVFVGATYALHEIIKMAGGVDAAIIIFGEDDRVWVRSLEFQQPRDNVLVEYGLFAGALGPEKTLICTSGSPKIPSNLAGIVLVKVDSGREESAREKLNTWLNTITNARNPKDWVRVVASNRHEIDKEYRERKYTARELDIVGIALGGALKEIAEDVTNALLKRVMFNHARVRLMFLTPLSPYVWQRAIEDEVSAEQLLTTLRESVLHSRTIYENMKTLFEAESKTKSIRRENVGSFEIRVSDFCPHVTIFRADKRILLGMYSAAKMGLHSPVMEVDEANGELFQEVREHFNKLWDGGIHSGKRESYLVRYQADAPPTLNEQLDKELREVSG